MKRSERLFDELGNADERYIHEAENYSRKSSRKLTYILSGIAALLVLTVSVNVWNNAHPPKKNTVGWSGNFKKVFVVPENNGDLPIITCADNIDFDGMGFEGIITDNINEIKGNNPWNEEWGLTELPVFHGDYLPYEFIEKYTIDEMKNILSELAEIYNAELDITDIHDGKDIPQARIDNLKKEMESCGETFKIEMFYSPSKVTAEIGNFNVELDSTGTLEIKTDTKNVPENCRPANPDDKKITSGDAEQRMKKFAENYNNLLRMENPVPSILRDYSYYGDAHTSCYIYDNSSDHLTALLNYSFNQTQLYTADGNINIRINNAIPTDNVIGMYPIIDEETAFENLMNGDYVTSVWEEEYIPDGFTEEDVTFCGVQYKRTGDYQYWLPYYRYLIKLDHDISDIPDNLDEYGGYYVPAVQPEYIQNINPETAFN